MCVCVGGGLCVSVDTLCCVLFSVYCAKVTMSHNIMSYCWQCVCIRVCVCVCVCVYFDAFTGACHHITWVFLNYLFIYLFVIFFL